MSRRVLIPLSESPCGPMSAPALRRFEIGRTLADEFDVTFSVSDLPNEPIDGKGAVLRRCSGKREFSRLLHEADFLYTLGILPKHYATIAASGIRVILDLYVPRVFEVLEASPNSPEYIVRRQHQRDIQWARSSLKLADYLVCTNQHQRDFWIGMLNGLGLLDVSHVRRSPDLSECIGIVPHGIRETPFSGNGTPLRDRFGLSAHDLLLLWSSRILAWQDPVSLMQAMSRLQDLDPSVKLVLVGTGSLPEEDAECLDGHGFRALQAVREAQSLDLLGENVFFIEERIPYADLGSFYRDCDVAVGSYPASLETHFCLATRLLDYLQADLPIVLTGATVQREFMEQMGCGEVVAPGDVDGFVAAILKMKSPDVRQSYVRRIRERRERLEWNRIVGPIREYCRTSPLHRLPSVSKVASLAEVLSYYRRHIWIRLQQMTAS